MRLVKQSAELLSENHDDPLEQIGERAGICYQKVGNNTRRALHCLRSNHGSTLEQARIYIKGTLVPGGINKSDGFYNLFTNKYIEVSINGHRFYISGSVRAFREMKKRSLLDYEICDLLNREFPELFEEGGPRDSSNLYYLKRIKPEGIPKKIRDKHGYRAFKFVAQRGTLDQLFRHRPPSTLMESTRYCDYRKAVTFVMQVVGTDYRTEKILYTSYELAEAAYKAAMEDGVPREVARGLLPLHIKAEGIMYASLEEWKYIINLRTTKAASPMTRNLMMVVKDQLEQEYEEVF